MQRAWQVLCDRVVAPGVTLMAGTIVEQLRGARTIHGWTAVRVVDGPQVGRVAAMRVESSSQWLNLAPVRRLNPETCAHGVDVMRPWACSGCVVAAVAHGLRAHVDLPEIPSLPRDLSPTYFERMCEEWGRSTGRAEGTVNLGRIGVERWLAHDQGITWGDYCRRTHEADEEARGEDLALAELGERETAGVELF